MDVGRLIPLPHIASKWLFLLAICGDQGITSKSVVRWLLQCVAKLAHAKRGIFEMVIRNRTFYLIEKILTYEISN